MVLPDRIELSTSPLPMECSTTELRQHARDDENRPKRVPTGGPILATRPPLAQARGQPTRARKTAKICVSLPLTGFKSSIGADPGPDLRPEGVWRSIGPVAAANSIISPASFMVRLEPFQERW